MRLGLKFKLAMVLLLVSTLVVVGTAVLMQWSFERGYEQQVEARQRAQVDTVIAALAEEYVAAGGWSRVQHERRRWLRIVFGARRDDQRLPRRARRFQDDSHSGGNALWPPPSPARDGAPRRLRLPMRMMLLDAGRELLIGDPARVADLALNAIEVDGRGVGYLGLLPGPTLNELADIAFVEQQQRNFVLIAGAFVLLAGVLAIPLSGALTGRVRAIAHAARELAAGHYDTRVAAASDDELGRLARDFNDLASALQRTERSRREWMADISHELRTPLATMRAEIEAMQDGVRVMSAEAVDALHADVMRLGRLVDDLYDLSRADLGALSYHKSSLDPCAVLRADLQAMADEFAHRDITVSLDAPAAIRVHADADRLSQLFRNLLTNSLRYTDAGGQLRIDVARVGGEARLSFQDSAPGVADSELEHLLERFYRVERSRNRDSGGAGLGLAICASIVQAHGGTLEVRHSALGGLGVHITLPVES